MYKQLAILLSICLTVTFCHGQKVTVDQAPIFVLKGQSLQTYFDTLVLPKGMSEPGDLHDDYDVIIYFNIDTNGTVINYRFEEDSLIPDKAKLFVQNLINLTSGKWQPEVNSGEPVSSDTISCLVGLRKKMLSKDREQRNKATENKLWEAYKSTHDISTLRLLFPINKLSTFGLNKNDCFFTFYY